MAGRRVPIASSRAIHLAEIADRVKDPRAAPVARWSGLPWPVWPQRTPPGALRGWDRVDSDAVIPAATALEQALLDGRLVAARESPKSRTWIPSPGSYELPDAPAFRSAALAAAERSRAERGLPPE